MNIIKSLIILLVIFCTIKVFPQVPNYGLLDETRPLDKTEAQVRGFITLSANIIKTGWYTQLDNIYSYNINSLGYDNNGEYYSFEKKYNYISSPLTLINLGVMTRIGLPKGFEFGFNISFFYRSQLFMIDIGGIADFYIKKSIVTRDHFCFSYKLNLGFDYVGLGADFVMKHSLLLGVNGKKLSFNIIPGIQGSFYAGQLIYDWIYFTLSPNIELNLNFHNIKGFTWGLGLFFAYNIVFGRGEIAEKTSGYFEQSNNYGILEYQSEKEKNTDYSYSNTVSGSFDVGFSLSFGGRFTKKKYKNNE